jgi:hypothetical protein
MKSIKVLCEIAGEEIRYPVYIGRPTPGLSRFHYQAAWLREVLGARILSSEGGEGETPEINSDQKSGTT